MAFILGIVNPYKLIEDSLPLDKNPLEVKSAVAGFYSSHYPGIEEEYVTNPSDSIIPFYILKLLVSKNTEQDLKNMLTLFNAMVNCQKEEAERLRNK